MDSTHLCSFLLTVITGTVFPGHVLAYIAVTDKSYEQAVLPYFVNGLKPLMVVAETLLTSTDLEQGIENVRQPLEWSYRSMSKAEQSSLAQVRALSADVEKRLEVINRLNDDQKALLAREQDLKVKLSGQQGQESIATQQLEAAKDALKNVDNALDSAIRAWHSAEDQRDVGLALVVVPIIGSIAGAIIIHKADAAIEHAVKEAREAQRMKDIYKAAVEKYESELQSYREEIRHTERTISANTVHIKALQRDLNSERLSFQKLKNFLIPLRKCTTLLSILAGKTGAASMFAEFSGSLDDLLGVLDEIIVTLRPLVENSADYSILVFSRLPDIIHKLEDANRRLKDAAAS
ncbi:uncharacterized protein LOC144820079 [Lissotriton helveticus]